MDTLPYYQTIVGRVAPNASPWHTPVQVVEQIVHVETTASQNTFVNCWSRYGESTPPLDQQITSSPVVPIFSVEIPLRK